MKRTLFIILTILILSLSGCIYFQNDDSIKNDNQSNPIENNDQSNNPIKDYTSSLVNSNNNSSYLKKNNDSINKLLIPENNIYFGAFPDFGGPEDNVTKERIEDFEKLAGKKIVWAYFSQNWFNGIKYPKDAIHIINNEGIIPFVRLMARSDEEEYEKERKFTLDNIINGKFDNELKKWAKDSKEDNIPLLVDFDVEMNGDLINYYDFAVVEECFEWNECEPFEMFIKQDKAVLGVEYNLKQKEFCDEANSLNFSWLKMDYALDGDRTSCYEY